MCQFSCWQFYLVLITFAKSNFSLFNIYMFQCEHQDMICHQIFISNKFYHMQFQLLSFVLW